MTKAEAIQKLADLRADPMWPDHAEVSKKFLKELQYMLAYSGPEAAQPAPMPVATEQLAALLIGLECSPTCATLPPMVLQQMGKAIAEQAKKATLPPSQPERGKDAELLDWLESTFPAKCVFGRLPSGSWQILDKHGNYVSPAATLREAIRAAIAASQSAGGKEQS